MEQAAPQTSQDSPRYQLVVGEGPRTGGVRADGTTRSTRSRPGVGHPAADGDAGDVDLAVAAARRALSGPWGQLTGFGRAG